MLQDDKEEGAEQAGVNKSRDEILVSHKTDKATPTRGAWREHGDFLPQHADIQPGVSGGRWLQPQSVSVFAEL